MEFYCDRRLEYAHDVMADVEATIDVFEAQIKRYGLEPNAQALAKQYEGTMKYWDNGFYIKENEDGKPTLDFGKHLGKTLTWEAHQDKKWLHWLLRADFSTSTKQAIQDFLENK